jgi:outer membrane protein
MTEARRGMARLGIAAAALMAIASGAPVELSLEEAVAAALRNYPSIRVSQEQLNAAAAAIRAAQSAYLPRIDGLAQVNRATRNNIFGLLLPQSVLPSISGPVLGTNNLGAVWGSAVGLGVAWQPFDFGLRRARVETASAERDRAEAVLKRTRFDVSVATADSFLTVLAAERTAEAARAAVESWQVLLKSTQALVAAQLRPGADESRVQAELAQARTQLAQAEQAIQVGRANLAQFVGVKPQDLKLRAGRMLDQLPPQTAEPALNVAANPLVAEQSAAVRTEEARLHALERSWYPEFLLQGAAYARGSGAELDGRPLGGLNGLAPGTQNYALGLTITFPFMDRFSINAQKATQQANVNAGRAQSDVIAAQLEARFRADLARLEGARQVAANTPVEVSSAQAAVEQNTARYKSGLAPIDDLAQAQRLLVQARIDDALARLAVWRSELELQTVRGDISKFVKDASAGAETGGPTPPDSRE